MNEQGWKDRRVVALALRSGGEISGLLDHFGQLSGHHVAKALGLFASAKSPCANLEAGTILVSFIRHN